MKNKPIGIMDSGVGGFSTSFEVKKMLSNESIIAYGDLLYMPYGQKTQDFLKQRVRSICTHLEKVGCKAIVIACNTASTVLLNFPEIFAHIQIPIFNVISSMTSFLKENIQNPSLFTVLATQATVDSRVYDKQLSSIFPTALITSIPALEWASLVESVPLDSDEMMQGINKYLDKIENSENNTILLACTHFYYLENTLKKKIPLSRIINTSTPVVQELKKYLHHNDLSTDSPHPQYKIFASKTSTIFENMGRDTFCNPTLQIEINEINE